MTDVLLREWQPDDILTLTINRPERRNAVDPEVLTDLAEALTTEGDRAAAVILRGAGNQAFCAGYDLTRLTGTAADLDADRFIGRAVSALRECPAPVIARLAGHCHGAGVELALSCDVRMASQTLSLSVPAVRLGVVYRYEFIVRLVQICGLVRASELLLGMQHLDANAALMWGFVTQLFEVDQLDRHVYGLAADLAATPRAAVRGTKATLRLIEKRSLTEADAAAAHRLREFAAASPERQEALNRRKKRVTG